MFTDANTSPPPEQQEEDEWTHVKSKARRRGPKNHVKHKAHTSEAFQPRAGNLRSSDEIAAEYRKIRAQFEIKAASKELCRLSTEHGPTSIDRAICLGIGTFDPPDGGWETKRRTFAQLTAFLVMVDALEKKSGHSIECIFQEPVFTSSDKEFLVSLGHNCVDSPDGFEAINKNTLLFGIHLYRPIYAKALEKSLPAVFVGTDLEVWDLVSIGESDDLAKAKIMEETYKKTKCPQDASSTAFSGTSIYWRPAQERVLTTDEKEKDAGGSVQGEAPDETELTIRLQSISFSS